MTADQVDTLYRAAFGGRFEKRAQDSSAPEAKAQANASGSGNAGGASLEGLSDILYGILGGGAVGLAAHHMTPKDRDENLARRLLSHVLFGSVFGALAGNGIRIARGGISKNAEDDNNEVDVDWVGGGIGAAAGLGAGYTMNGAWRLMTGGPSALEKVQGKAVPGLVAGMAENPSQAVELFPGRGVDDGPESVRRYNAPAEMQYDKVPVLDSSGRPVVDRKGNQVYRLVPNGKTKPAGSPILWKGENGIEGRLARYKYLTREAREILDDDLLKLGFPKGSAARFAKSYRKLGRSARLWNLRHSIPRTKFMTHGMPLALGLAGALLGGSDALSWAKLQDTSLEDITDPNRVDGYRPKDDGGVEAGTHDESFVPPSARGAVWL